ncbi:MAG: hypothetical protein PHP50_00775 [Lachnospiraceae bacterium]|nr:hypothetical protein [Lachnospiraceae bacterium]
MKHSKSSLFLMEMIISIMFFSLASAACIQLFVKAHFLDKDSIAQNNAVVQAQNLAEGFGGCDGDLATMKSLFPSDAITPTDHELFIYFDAEWKYIDAEDAVYCAALSITGERSPGSMLHGHIAVTELDAPDSDPIYTLDLDQYFPERSAAK